MWACGWPQPAWGGARLYPLAPWLPEAGLAPAPPLAATSQPSAHARDSRAPAADGTSEVWVQYVGVDADGNDTYVLTSTSEECVHLSREQVTRAVQATEPVNKIVLESGSDDDDDACGWASPYPPESTYHAEEYSDSGPAVGSYPDYVGLEIGSDAMRRFSDYRTWDGADVYRSRRAASASTADASSGAPSGSEACAGPRQQPLPGPAKYGAVKPDATSRMRSAPAFSFGKAARAPRPKRDEGPGPGASAGPGAGIGAAAGKVDTTRFSRAPAYSIGRRAGDATADAAAASAGPGPGKYLGELPAARKGVVFGKEARGGPGVEEEAFPGPADYGAPPPRPAGKGVTFAVAKRVDAPHAGRDGPGPGKYSGDVAVKRHGPAATLTSRPKDAPAVGGDGPGPGLYMPPEVRSKKGGVMAGTYVRDKPADTGPGPGKYSGDVAVKQHGPAATLTSRPKDAPAVGGDGPGPGLYMPPEVRSKKGGVMAGTYVREKPADVGPGPMAYNDAAVRKAVPAVSMTFRQPDKHDPAVIAAKRGGTDLIGVSHDEHNRGKRGPAASIVGRPKAQDETAAPTPGPNAYLSTYATGRRSSAATIVGRPKSPKRAHDAPGPGLYKPPEIRSTKGAVLVGRYKSKEAHHEPGPGPGAYNVTVTHKGHAAKSSKGATIKGRPSVAVYDDPHPDPGPGDYNVTVTHKGHATRSSKGATMKFRPNNDVYDDPHPDPGPGDYAPPPAPKPKGGAYVMKPATDKARTSEHRRTLGALNDQKLKAMSEQARRRASAQREQGALRKQAARVEPRTRYAAFESGGDG